MSFFPVLPNIPPGPTPIIVVVPKPIIGIVKPLLSLWIFGVSFIINFFYNFLLIIVK